MSTVLDDRRVQLYKDGAMVSDRSIAEAFAAPQQGTYDLWKAYYESYGFQTGRTGDWSGDVLTEPGNWIEDPPIIYNFENGNGSTNYVPYILGGLFLFFMLRKK